ncbi:hypothetical protein Lbir_2979 [Legionella birminghamensis]|uniref:Uncharacterized protein n=1 Tax=Legionella birminghamensis TaxID=28083 RepID=A0A378I6S6_9GAMM|nr:hypothetical protein [Legionella birminghamensis]KTC68377.1 hypothetical protein Lbir_2979 [Legionella birminghamensis]STX30907.1 Uncharacterised protein [Legionella birminghamensis]
MDYRNLIDANLKRQHEQTFRNTSSESFQLAAGVFMLFTRKDWQGKQIQTLEDNWKAHISVSSGQLAEAWNLLYPLLHNKAGKFKIINQELLSEAIDVNQKKLDYARQEYQRFLTSYHSNQMGHSETLDLAYQLSPDPSQIPKVSTTKKLREYIEKRFQDYINDLAAKVEENQRLSKGMQITVYIPPGEEENYQNLLIEIEARLSREEIKPGEIYPSDRQLGIYTSVRHPGKNHVMAVGAASYNPDQIPDPFRPMPIQGNKPIRSGKDRTPDLQAGKVKTEVLRQQLGMLKQQEGALEPNRQFNNKQP